MTSTGHNDSNKKFEEKKLIEFANQRSFCEDFNYKNAFEEDWNETDSCFDS